MKQMGFLVFFSIILLLYALIHYYIIVRGLSVLPAGSSLKPWFIFAIIAVASAFLAGRLLERLMINWFTAGLIWIGSFWLAIMVYLLLQLAVIDLVKGLNSLFGFFPEFITDNPLKTRQITAMVVLSITILMVGLGHLNTWFPTIREYTLDIDKDGGKLQELRIAALSDIHLGTTMEKRHMRIIVDRVNALKPDIILIPGDIIDEDIRPVINSGVGDNLKDFQSKYGVYAVTGNHEYIGGVVKAKKYLAEHDINLLSDTVMLFDDSFYVAGREDLTINSFTDKNRKELHQILRDIDPSKPLILLDHQPFRLNTAQENGVDLQLSGHTHHGQLWPFNYITKLVYEVSWGYKKKGDTHIYVSSGVGGWGPPIRTVNRSEIVYIRLVFHQSSN